MAIYTDSRSQKFTIGGTESSRMRTAGRVASAGAGGGMRPEAAAQLSRLRCPRRVPLLGSWTATLFLNEVTIHHHR